MEKQRAPPGPKGRGKRALPPPGDFIALGKIGGSKPSTSTELKQMPPLSQRKTPTPVSTSVLQREKRKELSPVTTGGGKQSSLGTVLSPSPIRGKESGSLAKALDQLGSFDSPVKAVKLVDAPVNELENLVMNAFSKDEHQQVDGLICAALKTLKLNRLKPDPMIYLTLVSLVKRHPEMFTGAAVVEHLLQFLRREQTGIAVKPKPNTLLCIMSCNILLHAFQGEDTWPQSLIKAYVEDALGDRSWVDNENNKTFVQNIIAAFGTILVKKPSQSVGQRTSVVTSTMEQSSSNLVVGGSEQEREGESIVLETSETSDVFNRYALKNDSSAIQSFIHEVVKEQLNKRQMIDSISRNLLRFLTTVCGYSEVRLLASQRLETWLQNPKLTRPAQELLMSVAMNCNSHSLDDIEVIGNLVRMRLKTKPLANQYITAMKELLSQHPENLGTTLKHVIFNELSQQRNPNNMSILSHIFTIESENAARFMALVFQDLLANREDYLRAIRALLREIVRSLKHEVNFVAFCRGMMEQRQEPVFINLDQPYKERMLASVIDLICMTSMLSASGAVREQAQALAKGEKRDYSVLHEFQSQLCTIQRDAVWFFHTKVMLMYSCSEKDFVSSLNKILFLEQPEHYHNKDSWPPESDRTQLLNMMKEVPLAEDALLRLHFLGLSDDFPINCADTLDIIEKMVTRSAILKSGTPGLEIQRTEVVKMLLSLSAYAHPKEIQLPVGYTPPALAISNLYWKSWLILLMIAASNPSTVGLVVWESYPTMKCMMEMIITGHYDFPPLSSSDSNIDEVKANELQILRAEVEDILVFEGHLAAATNGVQITRSNSLLVSQLISLEPSGPPRKPPAVVMDKLKFLNKTYGLGAMLCQCRQPDFLLYIIQSQGSSRSMPWLADLVHSSEGSLSALPIQCLCEFLLMKYSCWEVAVKNDSSSSKDKQIRPKVIARLQDLLVGSDATSRTSSDVIKYFVNRWSSAEMRDRGAALQGLQSILLYQKSRKTSIGTDEMEVDDSDNTSESRRRRNSVSKQMLFTRDETFSWLHQKLPSLPYFEGVVGDVVLAMRQALYVEMDVPCVQAYIIFLGKYAKHDEDESSLIEDLSQLITTRSTVIKRVLSKDAHGRLVYETLLNMFAAYMKTNMKSADTGYDWEENPEKICVTWSSGSIHDDMKLEIHIRVLHACIVLLSHGPTIGDHNSYNVLMDAWFPQHGDYKAVYLSTGDPVEVLQHWLRMLMVRSDVPKLVEAGLINLTPDQLLLFLQASGFPVDSLSKILELLDEISEKEPDVLLQSVVDRDSLVQVTEIAWARGADGGKKFCSFLLEDESKKEEDSLTIDQLENSIETFYVRNDKFKPMTVDEPMEKQVTGEKISKVLHLVFSKETAGNFGALCDFADLKMKISSEIVSKMFDDKGSVLMTTLSCINNLLSDHSIVSSFCKGSTHALSLLRLCCVPIEIVKDEYQEIMKSIVTKLDANGSLSCGMEKLISFIYSNQGLVRSSIKSSKQTLLDLMECICKPDNESLEVIRLTETLIDKLKVQSKTKEKEPSVETLLLVSKAVKEKAGHLFGKLLEAICKRFVCNSDSSSNNKRCMDFLVEGMRKMPASVEGLLVDWLEVVDSEITRFDPLAVRQMLFLQGEQKGENPKKHQGVQKEDDPKRLQREQKEDSPKPSHNMSYLTSLLAQQTRNGTLQDCLHWILSSTNCSFNATSCLNLVEAVVSNPRLWQGQERSQHRKPTDGIELNLSISEIVQLIHLMLLEIQDITKLNQSSKNKEAIVEKRLVLLNNHVTGRSDVRLKKAIKLVVNRKNVDAKVVDYFMQRFYLFNPTLLDKMQLNFDNNSQEILSGKETKVDSMIHRLILSISEPEGSMAWEERYQNTNAIMKRVAMKHPLLVMRQLPVALSLLQGKSRLVPSDFRYSNELMYCTHVLGLVDCLRPHVFMDSPHSKQIMSMFVSVFLALIQSPCLMGAEQTGVVTKFVDIINHYIVSGNKDALGILSKHEAVFNDMLVEFPANGGVKSVTTFISANKDIGYECPSLVLSSTSSSVGEKQLTTFKQRLSVGHHFQDLLAAINDLDEASKRKVDILEQFMSELPQLALSKCSEVRDKAHLLILRHYRDQPDSDRSPTEIYMRCLESDDIDVCLTAASYIPKFLLVCDDNCERLMLKMHSLSVSNRSDLDKYISLCVKNLNADY